MKTQLTLQADIYQEIYIDPNESGELIPVIHQSIYLENDEDPVFSKEEPIADVLDRFIEFSSIPNGTVTEEQRSEMLKQLDALKAVIDNKIEKIKQLPNWQKE